MKFETILEAFARRIAFPDIEVIRVNYRGYDNLVAFPTRKSMRQRDAFRARLVKMYNDNLKILESTYMKSWD